jgi:hypothetical protein
MLFNVPWLEWVGYLSSVLVAVSLTMSSIKKLRWYNMVGAGIFSFYGFAIGSLPVGMLNLFIVLVNVYYLFKMSSLKESFNAISVAPNDPYLQYFIKFNMEEINEFFPKFDTDILLAEEDSKKIIAFLLLRNAEAAGVFVGVKNNHILYLHLDFVTQAYRDLKPGDFVYKKNISMLKELGIQQIICNTENPRHTKYLLKMGFVQKNEAKPVFEMNLK